MRRALRARPAWQHTAGRAADRPSDVVIQLVAFWIADEFTRPDGGCEVRGNDIASATGLRRPTCVAAMRVLMATGLLSRPDNQRPTSYAWNVVKLEELALHDSQLAQNESCASAGTRAPDVVAAPRRAPSATIHLDVAAAQGICRALGFDGIQTRDKWLTVSGVGAWKKDRPASWAETCERIEACASAANVQDEQFARELLFNFCKKDPRVVAEGGAPLMLLNKSPAWVMTSQQFGSRKRVRAELERPTSTPPDVVGFAGAADALAELEALAGRAAGGAR